MSKKSIKAKIKTASTNGVSAVQNSPRSILRAKVAGNELAIVARRGSYRAANNPRSRVQTPYGGSGDQHVDPWTRRIVRELSRDMERNADSYRTLLDEYERVTVGNGVRAVFRTENAEWNQKANELLHKKFSAVEGGLDCRQLRNWYQLQALFARNLAMDGDVGLAKLNNFTVQMFESEQITSGVGVASYGPDLQTDGIKLNSRGAPVLFMCAPFDRNTGALDYGRVKEYSPNNFVFTAICTRMSQTRGMPLIVAGLESWERIDSYVESEVIAAEQGSLVYGAIEYPEGQLGFGKTYLPGQPTPGGPVSGAPSAGFNGGFNNDNQVDWHGTNAGYLMELPNGAKYVPINPQRPSRDAAPFMIEMLRQFTSNAGLAYEITYNDLRGLSWSVHRGLVALSREKIASQQFKYLEAPFRNVVVWATANLIEAGELEEIENWDSFDLSWPRLAWPDEGKEYEAQTLGLSKGLTTRHQIFGHEWRTMLDDRMEELEYAAELCVEFNKKYAGEEEKNPDADGSGGFANFDKRAKENAIQASDMDGEESDDSEGDEKGKDKSGDKADKADKKAKGFRITPQELLGYVDFLDPASDKGGSSGGAVGAPKNKSKVGGADELKDKDTKTSRSKREA